MCELLRGMSVEERQVLVAGPVQCGRSCSSMTGGAEESFFLAVSISRHLYNLFDEVW